MMVVTFPPFHILFQNSHGRSDQRISLPEMRRIQKHDFINPIVLSYRYKSNVRVARVFTLILKWGRASAIDISN